jgi:oligoendopeptidase F
MGWRYINSSRETDNEQNQEAFRYFIEEIEPHIQPLSNELDKKLMALPFAAEVDITGLPLYLRSVQNSIALFREENIPLQMEMQLAQQEYGAMQAAMTINYVGKEYTLQQAGVFLQSPDRAVREEVWKLMQSRRLQDQVKLQKLFTKLIGLRHQIALNAGFKNYRDYAHVAMGRFDYGVQDCVDFQDSVAEFVVPVINDLMAERKKNLGLDSLRPWDLACDEKGLAALKPFDGGEDLKVKGIACLNRVQENLGSYLETMDAMGHLDLVSRKGKAPGGYNYPLDEKGVPFIFMNATSTLRDMVTLMHEAGHAIHSIETRNQPLEFFKHTPSEAAELASMSMELMSMEYWDVYFSDAEELKRARAQQLHDVLDTLPWVATIDAFQHWIYTNPEHSVDERQEAFKKIYSRFASNVVDWTGLEENRNHIWQKQLHLYEVPFYYIEYGFAQLGAIAVWRNYKQQSQEAFMQYMAALQAGYSISLPEIYKKAGISFDFSSKNISSMMAFVVEELKKLA